MPFERRIASFALVACASLVLCAAVSASGERASRITQAQFLGLAQSGIQAAQASFWNAKLGWYDDRLGAPKNPRMPLAYLWSAFPLFEAIDAVAIAEPTAANKAAVVRFATAAERYWNGALEPQGGFAYYPGVHDPHALTYFDDNGWWGIAFLDAFRATGDRAYLTEAARASTSSSRAAGIRRAAAPGGTTGTGTSPPSRSPPRPTSGPSSTSRHGRPRTCSR